MVIVYPNLQGLFLFVTPRTVWSSFEINGNAPVQLAAVADEANAANVPTTSDTVEKIGKPPTRL